jgi:hypothetical protein
MRFQSTIAGPYTCLYLITAFLEKQAPQIPSLIFHFLSNIRGGEYALNGCSNFYASKFLTSTAPFIMGEERMRVG